MNGIELEQGKIERDLEVILVYTSLEPRDNMEVHLRISKERTLALEKNPHEDYLIDSGLV